VCRSRRAYRAKPAIGQDMLNLQRQQSVVSHNEYSAARRIFGQRDSRGRRLGGCFGQRTF
jgi:hypothetical protein